MKYDKILTEATHFKMTVREALRFVNIFCDHANWEALPNSESEAMTVLAAEVIRLRELTHRSLDMINVLLDSYSWTWLLTKQNDQLVKNCNDVLS